MAVVYWVQKKRSLAIIQGERKTLRDDICRILCTTV